MEQQGTDSNPGTIESKQLSTAFTFNNLIETPKHFAYCVFSNEKPSTTSLILISNEAVVAGGVLNTQSSEEIILSEKNLEVGAISYVEFGNKGYVVVSLERQILLCDLDTKEVRSEVSNKVIGENSVYPITGFAQRGQDVFYCSADGRVGKLTHITALSHYSVYRTNEETGYMSIACVGDKIYLAKGDSTIDILDAKTETLIKTIFKKRPDLAGSKGNGFILGMIPIKGKNIMILALTSGAISILDLATDTIKSTIGLHSKEIISIDCMLLQSDTVQIATGSEDGVISIIEYYISEDTFNPISCLNPENKIPVGVKLHGEQIYSTFYNENKIKCCSFV